MKKFLAIVLLVVMMWTMSSISLAEECEEEYEVVTSTVEMTAKVDTELRLWAMIEGPAYGTLLKGESVEVTCFYPDAESVWGEIRYDNPDFKYGYIDAKDLYFSDGRQFKFAEYMEVTGNTVNIREYGNIQAEPCGMLYKGDIVYVDKFVPTSDGRIWACCRNVEDEYIGWVSMRYLTVAEIYG